MISFAAPELLLLLIPALGLTLLLSVAARHRLGTGRRRLALVVRSIVLACLVLALAGLQLVLPVDRLTTVFVVDLSDSVGSAGREAALAFVRESLEEMPDGDRAGIVAFGDEALVERLPSDLQELDAIASVVTRSATDIGAALRLGAAVFPDESQKRIVLVSDGNDTTGEGQSEAALAAARGIQVETRVVGLGDSDEVIVERVRTPTTARIGEQIEAEVTVRSTLRQPATIRLYGDGASIASQQVTLEAGVNRFVFTTRATEAGFHTFRAVVEAAGDTFGQNNRADSDTIVKGDPRILVVADDAAVADQLVGALEAERQDVTRTTPEGVPTSLAELAGYDSVVIVDVPAARLGAERMEALQLFTRDLGRGLVMIGGQGSYGAGGYKQTPLEEALPVEMDVRDRRREPDVALVVVLDSSGSMDACHCNTAMRDGGTGIAGVPKVDIGKEAILRAVAALTERDEFGVVTFNENASWVIHTAPLGTVGNVEDEIAGIRPLGQTNIFAGLSAAVDELEQASAERRHIVLLTDGWSSSGDYDALLERMAAANITLSAVGAGGGSAEFLEGLAEQGGGRYYPAANPATIPDIFLKETQQVSGQQIVEEPFFPIQTASSPILGGLEEGLPQLRGYNGTTPKPAAQTVLVSARDDPVLVQWQYGLGRSVAWTSDATGRWAQDWVAWSGFNRFFSQLVAWTFPGEETGGIEAELIADGDETRLRLESLESDGTPRDFYATTVNLVSPDLGARTVTLTQTEPGVYEASLGRLEAGAYAARVSQTKAGATPLARTLGLVAPTAAEYRLLGTNEELLADLRNATGGRPIEAVEDVWRHDLQRTAFATDLWPLLLLVALLLWPLDVAIRRVSLARGDLTLARSWVADRWRRSRGPAERPQPVEGLMAARARAGGVRTRATLAEPRQGAPAAEPEPTAAAAPTAEVADEQPPSGDTPAPTSPEETLARLRDAKRRARR